MISSSFHTWGCLGGDILSGGNLFGDVSQHTDNVLGKLFYTALNNRWWNAKEMYFQPSQRPSKFCFRSLWDISCLWLGFVCLFKLQCFASLCFIKLRDERRGLKFSGDICPSVDTGLLAWFSCTWIACGRGGDGKAASSLLVLFQHRFCRDPSAPCKAQSWLSNGVHKGSSWPATLGGSLTLCRDAAWWCSWSQRDWKAKVGKEGSKAGRYTQLLQCCCAGCRGLDRWNLCGCFWVFICTAK